MTVTAVYNSDLGRVQITATGLGAATTASVERSLDQITWTTVRGAGAVTVTAGVMDLTVSDYEFSDGINYYRVRGLTSAPITYVASGGFSSATNSAGTSSLGPVLPAGLVDGDLMVIQASIRNSGVGTVNVPAGWTQMFASGNVALIGRRYVTGDAAPTITFTGGVANATLLGRIHGFRNAELVPAAAADLLNASAANVAYPALTVPADNLLILVGAWKQDAWTSVAQLAGMTEIADNASTNGDDASQALDYVVQTTGANIAAASFVVTGGISAISRGYVVALEHADYITEQTTSVTPSLATTCGTAAVWLKSIARPFLNRTVQVVHTAPAVTRPARTGVFDIVGRTNPVAVNDVRKSRRWTMLVRTESQAEAELVDLLLVSGDVLYVQVPAACEVAIPAGYVSVGDVTQEWHPLRPESKLWTLPVVEVAPPGADVVGATITWQSVITAYPTWNAVVAANATWSALLTQVGSPTDVIVA